MGVNISELVNSVKRTITIENLYDKTIAIDAFNTIYQFITTIRGSDGKSLVNTDGNITSHISGLLYRNTMLLENGVLPIYCFDGLLKYTKLRHINNIKSNPNHNYIRINESIINSSKELLDLMGIPYIQAPSEGEAQCVELCKEGFAWATASQDYDVLLYGGKRLIRNLGRNKIRKKNNTITNASIEFVSLRRFFEENSNLKNQKNLIDLGILIGNDYFPGIKGVGVATAMNLFKDCNDVIKDVLHKYSTKGGIQLKDKSIITDEQFYIILDEIRNIFLKPIVLKKYNIIRDNPDLNLLYDFLIITNNFSPVRVKNVIKRLDSLYTKKQLTLDKWG